MDCYFIRDAEKPDGVDRLGLWKAKWQPGGVRGWEKSGANPLLVRYADRLGPPGRVLVPLCGKTLDIGWLREAGHDVVGVEGVPRALAELRRDLPLDWRHEVLGPSGWACAAAEPSRTFSGPRPGYVFTTRRVEGQPKPVTGYHPDTSSTSRWRADRAELVQADFFAAKDLIEPCGLCWDRGSLVAVPPGARDEYVRTVLALLGPNPRILLCVLDYNPPDQGPPFGVSRAEVERLFKGFKVEQLEAELADVKDIPPKLRRFDVVEALYLITAGTTAEARPEGAQLSGWRSVFVPTWLLWLLERIFFWL